MLVFCFFIVMASDLYGEVLEKNFAFVTNQGDDTVSVIKIKDFKILKSISVGKAPAGIVVDDINHLVFVSNAQGKSITVIDINSLKVKYTIQINGSSVGLDVSFDGSYLYVADWFNNLLLVYSNPKLKLLKKINVGKAPAGVVSGRSGLVYVANRDDNTISVVSNKLLKVINTIKVGNHPFGLGLSPKEDRLLVANVKSHDISIIDLNKTYQALVRNNK